MPASDITDREEGAILLLALVFVLVISLMLVALVSLAGNDLIATSHLKSLRSLEYASDGAVDAAVQAVRYQPDPAGVYAAPSHCTPGGSTSLTIGPSGDPTNTDTATVQVWCSGALNATGRVVTFAACPSPGALTYNTCLSNAVLLAQVTFDDFALNGATAQGTGITVNSWVVQTANH
jgi:hypothetical protein